MRLVLDSLLLPKVMVILLMSSTSRCRIHMSSRLLQAYLPALSPWCLAHQVQMLCLKYIGSANALYPLLPLGNTYSGDTSLLLEPAWVSQPPWSCSVCPWMLAVATIFSWSLHLILLYLIYPLNIKEWNLCLPKFLSWNFPSQNCPVWIGPLGHN